MTIPSDTDAIQGSEDCHCTCALSTSQREPSDTFAVAESSTVSPMDVRGVIPATSRETTVGVGVGVGVGVAVGVAVGTGVGVSVAVGVGVCVAVGAMVGLGVGVGLSLQAFRTAAMVRAMSIARQRERRGDTVVLCAFFLLCWSAGSKSEAAAN